MENKMSIYEKLSHIQNELHAPKSKYNSFGKYNYRSLEDIVEASKPICMKYRSTLVLKDEVVNIDGRFYVKSYAVLVDWDSELSVESIAMAREDESKKGMDGSQITGASSSYARKYCLNGLFNIDDTKDADTDEYANQQKKTESKKSNGDVEKSDYDGVSEEDAKNFTNLLIELKKAQTKLDSISQDNRTTYNDYYLEKSGLSTQNVGAIKPQDYTKASRLLVQYKAAIRKLEGN